MLYCAAMDDRQDALSRILALWGGTGLGRILATVLDAVGPLVPIGAQAIYTLEPLLGGGAQDWAGLGQTLEDPERLGNFIRALRFGEGDES
ncbi:MAG: hypothetical protein E4G99_07075 [Anaerolineales bacterium]|nr:MAG: hypothetical protein E4G99_07075 [Anaerolineales bacterium]